MTPRIAALIARWRDSRARRVAQRQRQYRKRDASLGYGESKHRDAVNRAQAERDVP